MKKTTVAILVVLVALCLCSCATKSVAYPRFYTIDEKSFDAVLKDSLSKVPAETAAVFGGEEALEKAIRNQFPDGFLKITLIDETRCTMTVTVNSSTNVAEGKIENGVVVFDIGGVKDIYTISKDWSTITGNWYGVDVQLILDES